MPRVTWDPSRVLRYLEYRTFTFFGVVFHPLLLYLYNPTLRSRNPSDLQANRLFSLFPFRSPLLWESLSFYFPGGNEMFQFSPYRFLTLCIHVRIPKYYLERVSPFGNLRIKVCLQLPGAYRCLPRPSSPEFAKSSVIDSL